jgi:outer membrane protein
MSSMYRMSRLLPLLAGLPLLSAAPASAQTLEQALSAAYQSNPSLLDERARLRAVDETLPQAEGGWRPTVTLTGSIGYSRTETTPGATLPDGRVIVGTPGPAVDLTPKTGTAQIVQPLYRGGRTSASIDQAKASIQGERARLVNAEQSVLLDCATTYFTVVNSQANLDLQNSNEQVLRRQLDAVNDEFRVGTVTRTDVSQAEARLAGAIAARIAAEGTLAAARQTFQRITGLVPGTLAAPAQPTALLPKSADEARNLAATDNPQVIASQFDENAARSAITVTQSQLLPQLNLIGTYAFVNQSQASVHQQDQAQVVAQLSVPLYEAGVVYSQVRQAKQTAGQRKVDIDLTRRSAIEAATTAFFNLQSANAQRQSLQAAIRADEIALEGVRQEASVGSRTVIEVLNAEQELLNAQTSLVNSDRTALTNAYQLLAAVGRLTAPRLNLPVQIYDYERNFRTNQGRWIGTSISDE